MKAAKFLLVGLAFCQFPSGAFAATPLPLAEYVRELRGDAFGTPNARDWEGTLLSLRDKAAEGDRLAATALAAAPAYTSYQNQLAGRKDLTDAEALQLYQLSMPILRVNMPPDTVPLTELEALSIHLYTAKTYLTLNDDIYRHNGRAKDLAVYVATLDQALSKLPTYDGIVFHVQNMGSSELAQQRLGKTISYKYYLSTSSERIGWQGNVRMIIHTRTGRAIDKYSVNPQEHEVLISRGVTLSVTKDPVLAAGVYTIEYDELPGR